LIKIGVTGHRYIQETNKIIKGVDQALEKIAEKFSTPFILLTALAEGADRLVAHRAIAMREDTQLFVLLPLKMEDYLDDFVSLTSKAEFLNLLEMADEAFEPEKVKSNEQAYWETGKKIVEHCDVLVAIWDGQAAQGEGGTGDIVELAREYGRPLAWIHAGNRCPGTNSPTSLGKDQGKVSYEGFG
jgi:hypothetical protein